MDIQQTLERLGYHPNEIKIYLACLKMGEGTIVEIAHITGMPRSTITEVLEHMLTKGIVKSYLKKRRKYWVAEPPRKFLTIEKDHEDALQQVIPILEAMQSESVVKPKLRLYSGVSEIKMIMDDIIETKHHIMGLVSEDDFRDFMGEDYMNEYIKRRSKAFLKIRLITPRTSDRAKSLKQNDPLELRHTRFLSEHINLRRISNFIYGDKVATISLSQKEPIGVIIEDPDFAAAMGVYFESLWHHSSEQ